jgi:anthranilate phosphoribosyltransferase
MDEISIGAPTFVAELKNGEVKSYTIQPEDFGMTRHPITELAVDGAMESLAMVNAVLNGEKGPAADIVILNAGAAIYAAGLAEDLQRGVEMAESAIASGAAAAKFAALKQLSNSF